MRKEAMSYKSETIAEVLPRVNSTFFLPALQREFVWTEEQISQLFDSLMRRYSNVPDPQCFDSSVVRRDSKVLIRAASNNCSAILKLFIVPTISSDPLDDSTIHADCSTTATVIVQPLPKRSGRFKRNDCLNLVEASMSSLCKPSRIYDARDLSGTLILKHRGPSSI